MNKKIDRAIAGLCVLQIFMTPFIPRPFLGDFKNVVEYAWYMTQSLFAFAAGMGFLQAVRDAGFRGLEGKYRGNNASFRHYSWQLPSNRSDHCDD